MATNSFIKCWHQNNFKSSFRRLTNILSSLILKQETAYIKNRFIGEGGRLTFDIVNICDRNNIGGFSVTIDIEKAFDSLGITNR